MKKIVIKEIHKGMGDIWIFHDKHDVTIQDGKHEDNAITLTRDELKVVLKMLNKLIKK